MIRFQTIDVLMPNLDFDKVRGWIANIIHTSNLDVGELYYHFCGDDTLLHINQERLGHDFYTDIITFPLGNCEDYISSEFCISLDRVAENALLFGRSFENELLRVIIHGVLHLIGYDDHTEEEEKQMRKKEEECLKLFYN